MKRTIILRRAFCSALFCASKLMCGEKGTEDAGAYVLSGLDQELGTAGKLRSKPQQRLCGAQIYQDIVACYLCGSIDTQRPYRYPITNRCGSYQIWPNCNDEFSNLERIGEMAPITDSENVQIKNATHGPIAVALSSSILYSFLACLAVTSLTSDFPIPCVAAPTRETKLLPL